MVGDTGAGYLSGLPEGQRDTLARANEPGLTKLRGYLAEGDAVAFLGAGVSVPLYPLWTTLIGQLVEAAAHRLTEQEAKTCRALAKSSPEEVVEILRRSLGVAAYREVLRQVLGAKTDEVSGRTWTSVQELICRCNFKGVVTTNYDPGIVDARMRARTWLSVTGFTIWDDELGLDRWRNGRIFGDVELPVLYAHGYFNRPDSVVLATTEYRRAYEGKLAKVLAGLVDREHLVWIGFSFADQRIGAILREVALFSGTHIEPGPAPEHVAIMPWDPGEADNDPGILAQRAEISYGARLVLYPAFGNDHSALKRLLTDLTDPRFPSATDLPRRAVPAVVTDKEGELDRSSIPAHWAPEPDRVEHFIGRAEELARLDRWAADPQVSLVGVTAWGGAGKTALVTHWVQAGGAAGRHGIRGVFGWSFYADPSADQWASGLLNWARRRFGVRVESTRRATAVLALLQAVPLLLVLDGLEVMQEGPAGDGFGRLLDGTLREVLSGACQQAHSGLVVLTSRFPFADLEAFDGGSARMLDVPPFTPTEGAVLLAAVSGGWVPEAERRKLVEAVDGHALAVTVLAGLLADRPPVGDLTALRTELAAAAHTDARVGRVLEFYSDRLSEPDRYLLAGVSLFARPVTADAVLAVAKHQVFGSRLAEWTPAMVQASVRDRLGGLVSWHPNRTISAHPLVRDTFRRLVLDAAETAAETALIGITTGRVASPTDALRVVEAIELLLDAGQWEAADDIYVSRCGDGKGWIDLPAARLGQRAATAFVATPARCADCATHLGGGRAGHYLNDAGLNALSAGDLATAREYLLMALRYYRNAQVRGGLSAVLQNLTECFSYLGQMNLAKDAAAEALSYAEAAGGQEQLRRSHVRLGWVAALTGDSVEAEQQFVAADQIEFAGRPDGDHLREFSGVRWADWLARTGRRDAAQALTRRNAEISRGHGWNMNVMWCTWQLGRLALAVGDAAAAGENLLAAIEWFRDGDYLTELATTLADLANAAEVTGDLDAAERHVAEAITIAAPRGLVPAQSAALAARARIRAAQAAASPDYLAQGRDAADAALRLATRHQLAWHELDALRAHAALDRAEGIDRGWAAKADTLYARLVPPDLDPDPLATVERVVAEEWAAQVAAAAQDSTDDPDED
jgi:tetratricopeptide (TPR) repeat protein